MTEALKMVKVKHLSDDGTPISDDDSSVKSNEGEGGSEIGEEEEEESYADVSCGTLEKSTEPELDFSPCAMPSKAGGKPVWLALDGLPAVEDLACPECHVQMVFLLQIQSSIERPDDDAFYRAIYVFCCKKCNRYTAFRGQLPDKNVYYQPEALGTAEEPAPLRPHAPREATCQVCGCAAPKTCSKCHHAHYCCEHHQILAWRGGHGKVCGTDACATEEAVAHQTVDDQGLMLPEYLIETQDEPDTDVPDPALDKRIHDLEESCRESGGVVDAATAMRDGDAEDSDELKKLVDLEFLRFQRRLRRLPDQVVRYMHGNVGRAFYDDPEEDGGGILEPLWCSVMGRPRPEDIPKCENCGAERVPEFQIMPQIMELMDISVHSGMDFGTLVVYTCSQSCSEKKGAKCHYMKEFVWTQMPAAGLKSDSSKKPAKSADDDDDD